MPPSTIRSAVWAMRAGAALALIQGVLSGFGPQNSMFSVQLGSAEAHSAHLVGSILGGIVMALVWLWMAWKNGGGRGWARVLSTVFFGIMCLVAIADLLGILGAAAGALPQYKTLIIMSGVIALLEWAAGLLAVIYMYRGESGQYYAAVRAQRAGYAPVPPGYPAAPPYGQPPAPGGQQPPPYGQDPGGPGA